MKNSSTALIMLLLAAVSSALAIGLNWPVKREIDLASGFGDYRSGRFHAGLDIRTGGVVGEPVYSPVDGYVWRLRTSYLGYGKVLYIRSADDHIFVFAHLAKFIPEIDKIVKRTQIESQRYYVDIYLPKDSIKVTAGQLLAQSGETGAGPPHLHFEERSADNRPINPLNNGFELEDNVPPVFERIGFQVTDDTSLFDVGLRKVFYKIKKSDKTGEYYLDTALYFNRPFGVLVDCYDLMRSAGMKGTVRKLSLYIDSVFYYESVFDTLDYSTEQSVNFEYDYSEAIDDHSRVRRLYAEDGNQFVGSRPINGFKGFVGEAVTEKLGKRMGKIVAEDCCGNLSALNFSFFWGPSRNIFSLDSTVSVNEKTTKFYFTGIPEYKNFEIDSVVAFQNTIETWGHPKFMTTEYTDDGKIICTAVTDVLHPSLLRLFVFTKNGCLIRDNLFNGILEQLPKPVSMSVISSDDEGLWVTMETPNRAASRGWVKLYQGDKLLGLKEARMFNMHTYRCFIPPKEEYATIDKIGLVLGASPDGFESFVDTLKFYAVGFGARNLVSDDGKFSVSFDENTLYRPMFVQVRQHQIINKVVLNLNSDSYEILPEVFRSREEFNVSYKMAGDLPKNLQTGLCWLDKKKGDWAWLENINENNLLTAKSRGGGMFAAVVDYDNPVISGLNIRPNQFYFDPELPIRFGLSDSLSSFEDDRSIVIKLDGQWVIPEYDPETCICTTSPNESLEAGEHHLAIEVSDRAGNKSEKYLKFKIRKPEHKK